MVADRAFDALADPVRRDILGLLSNGDEMSAGSIAEGIDRVGRTAVSTHLRILLTAGLIRERRDGRYRFYGLDPEGSARDVVQLLEKLFRSSLQTAGESTEISGDSVRDVM